MSRRPGRHANRSPRPPLGRRRAGRASALRKHACAAAEEHAVLHSRRQSTPWPERQRQVERLAIGGGRQLRAALAPADERPGEPVDGRQSAAVKRGRATRELGARRQRARADVGPAHSCPGISGGTRERGTRERRRQEDNASQQGKGGSEAKGRAHKTGTGDWGGHAGGREHGGAAGTRDEHHRSGGRGCPTLACALETGVCEACGASA